jgi:RNA polymerase sigma-70 factor (ECF subfamily)
VSTARFKAIDAMRRKAKFDVSLGDSADRIEADSPDPAADLDTAVADDQLRLIFTCCHPALAPEARTALTLREVCGLTTEEIGRAFLAPPSTIAQRIVRAKAKIRDAKIPYRIPDRDELPARLETVLQVLYLVFNEGYSASSGESLTRPDISGEAIRLARLLRDLFATHTASGGGDAATEISGLLGLMLLQESRRAARTSSDGDLILLEQQDRTIWDKSMIAEGSELVAQSMSTGRVGLYTLQAAIASVHSAASAPGETDWRQIVTLYDALLSIEPSPVVALNRAVAVAMRDGPEAGLSLIEELLTHDTLSDYHLVHSARGELCRRLGRFEEAMESFQRAHALTRLGPERRFIERQMDAVASQRTAAAGASRHRAKTTERQ